MNRLSLRNNRLNIPQMNIAKPEDVNMYPVGFRITRILTTMPKNFPGTGGSYDWGELAVS